nr:unnamed protein product [Digitaria exilis]
MSSGFRPLPRIGRSSTMAGFIVASTGQSRKHGGAQQGPSILVVEADQSRTWCQASTVDHNQHEEDRVLCCPCSRVHGLHPQRRLRARELDGGEPKLRTSCVGIGFAACWRQRRPEAQRHHATHIVWHAIASVMVILVGHGGRIAPP